VSGRLEMIVRLFIYNALLLGSCGYAFWRGRADERLTAAVCIIASMASLALLGPVRLRYSSVELGVLAVDILTLAAFTYVALRSERFWPLWVSGLQLTTSVTHVLKAIQPDLMPYAYSAAARLWSYPILIILAIGTWRGHRRLQMQRTDRAAT
jgi:hypothetical protein